MVDYNLTSKMANMFTTLGNSFTQTAMTGYMLHGNNFYGNSIFGCGFAMFPMSTMQMPYTSTIMGQMNQMSYDAAFQYGANLMQQLNAKNPYVAPDKGLAKNQYAGDLDANQDKTLGLTFDAASTTMIGPDGKAVAGKGFNIIDKFTNPKDAAKSQQEYVNAVSELGKSYGAMIDTESGDSNKKVSLEEFVKHELDSLGANATADEKAQVTTNAQIAFKKIDINGDGVADWKELAATMAALDSSENGKNDGTITSQEFLKGATSLYNKTSIDFMNKIKQNYTNLFGNGQ